MAEPPAAHNGALPAAPAAGGALWPVGPLLRPEQAAELLNVKTSWIYGAVRTNKLPCLRIGRHIRFTREMLEEWLRTTAERDIRG